MAGEGFRKALAGEEEVQITFVKKKGGKKRTIPIWFTVEGDRLELLPMYGLKTKWYNDVEASGKIEVKVKDQSIESKPKMVRDPAAVGRIRERFGAKYSPKYGAADLKRYYPTTEIALEILL